MSFDFENFVSGLDAAVSVEQAFQAAVLEAWRESFREATVLVDEVTHENLCGWAIANDLAIRSSLETALLSSGLLPDQVQKAFRHLEKQLAPRKDLSDLLLKLSNLAEDRGLDMLDLLAESRAASKVVSLFQKNATKQGIHEPLCVALINNRTGANVRAFRLKGGDHGDRSLSIRFDDSGKIFINESGKADRYSKDADIAIRVDSAQSHKIYLCSHKFARVGGGHQDNQLKDSSKFLRFALLSKGKSIPELASFVGLGTASYEIVPTLVLDGEFFSSHIPQLRDEFKGAKGEFLIASTTEVISRLSI